MHAIYWIEKCTLLPASALKECLQFLRKVKYIENYLKIGSLVYLSTDHSNIPFTATGAKIPADQPCRK